MSRIGMKQLQFVGMEPDGEGATALYFRSDKPLNYEAGQHGLLVVPRFHIRPFTVASAPGEDRVMLGTTLNSKSGFKRALLALQVGGTARLIGPLGSFTLARTAPSVVMLTQGIGVTPFRSMLRHAAMSSIGRRTTLIHVGAQHPFRIDTEADATNSSYPTSRGNFEHDLDSAVAAQPSATFMISGSPAFVASTVARLKAKGVNTSDIRRDKFYGYSGTGSDVSHGPAGRVSPRAG